MGTWALGVRLVADQGHRLNPFPTVMPPVALACERDRERCNKSILGPPEMAPAPPWLRYGYVGRKYSLLDRPLDVVPDCYTDFGL